MNFRTVQRHYSGLNLNQDKTTKPQTVQIVRQGEATPCWLKVNPLYCLRSVSIKANCSMTAYRTRSSEKYLSVFHFIKVAFSDDLWIRSNYFGTNGFLYFGNPVFGSNPACCANLRTRSSDGFAGAGPSSKRWMAILPSQLGNFAGGSGTISSRS